MVSIVKLLLKWFLALPLDYIIYGLIAFFCVFFILPLLVRLAGGHYFLKKIKALHLHPDKAPGAEQEQTAFAPRRLLKYSHLLEKYDRENRTQFLLTLGVDKLLLQRLMSRKSKRDFLKALYWIPQSSLFYCLQISLEKPRFAPYLIKSLSEHGDAFVMHKIAALGNGADFNGARAARLLQPWLADIRDMASEPDWVLRFFAFKILLYDPEVSEPRALWEAFTDPHPLIRKIVIREFKAGESRRLYEKLITRVLEDPIFEVRQAAWERIQQEFASFFSLELSALKESEIYHILELLREGSKEDENLALYYLESANLELRYMAASYLSQSHVLDRLCHDVDLGDKLIFERNFRLLKKASEVNIDSFLSYVVLSDNPATLLICAKILIFQGKRSLITTLARKVFALYREYHDEKQALFELYHTTLACISRRGNEEALYLLDRELHKRKHQEQLIGFILDALPERGEEIFLNSLFPLFVSTDFPCRKPLRNALRRMPQSNVLPLVFEIIKSPREFFPHQIRIEAVKLLGEMGLPFCFQAVLENISVLPLEEAREYAALLAMYSKDVFKRKTEELLQSVDVKIRAGLIHLFPALKDKEYLPYIREALQDAEPDVRIAGIWALLGMGEDSSSGEVLNLLRDPVSRVREQAALALGEYGNSFTLQQISRILDDEHEVLTVKKAAILGLKKSTLLDAVDILVEQLENTEQLITPILEALVIKTKKQEIRQIIFHFKAACPRLREKLSTCFKLKKEHGEEQLLELFYEEHALLTPYLADIFESTGYIEKRIRQLTHRDARVRSEAASFLSALGTPTAFRGVILAARDPDKEVRVKVVKALEKLETEEGKTILQSLRNDPDKRIRKYTEWALERIKTKSYESLTDA
jgi:HEAT repeat protein